MTLNRIANSIFLMFCVAFANGHTELAAWYRGGLDLVHAIEGGKDSE